METIHHVVRTLLITGTLTYVAITNWQHEVIVHGVVDLHLTIITQTYVVAILAIECYHEAIIRHVVGLFLTIITHTFVAEEE